MKIVFELESTLCDDEGYHVRPGVFELLEHMFEAGHSLVPWSAHDVGWMKKAGKSLGINRYFPGISRRSLAAGEFLENPVDIPLHAHNVLTHIGADLFVCSKALYTRYAAGSRYRVVIVPAFKYRSSTDETYVASSISRSLMVQIF